MAGLFWVKKICEDLVDKEEGGIMKVRGGVDQIFALRRVVEKVPKKKKKMYAVLMDLQKVYDRINREIQAFCGMLKEFWI